AIYCFPLDVRDNVSGGSTLNDVKLPSLEDLQEKIAPLLNLVCSTLFPGNESQSQNCTDALVQKAGLTNLPFLATKDVKTLSGVVQLVQTRGLDTEAVKNLLVAQEQLATAQSKVYDIKGQIEAVMDVAKVQRELANSIVSSQSLDPATKVSLLIDNALMSKPDLKLPVSNPLSSLSAPQTSQLPIGVPSASQLPLSALSMNQLPVNVPAINQSQLAMPSLDQALVYTSLLNQYSNPLNYSSRLGQLMPLQNNLGQLSQLQQILNTIESSKLENYSNIVQRSTDTKSLV
ncbi:MAG: hypothetical protein MHPSP_003174, partial [Paramarteilia canceri]